MSDAVEKIMFIVGLLCFCTFAYSNLSSFRNIRKIKKDIDSKNQEQEKNKTSEG